MERETRTSCLLTTGQVDTALADLGHVAVLEDVEVSEERTDLQCLLVARLDVRQVKQDVVPDGRIAKPRGLQRRVRSGSALRAAGRTHLRNIGADAGDDPLLLRHLLTDERRKRIGRRARANQLTSQQIRLAEQRYPTPSASTQPTQPKPNSPSRSSVFPLPSFPQTSDSSPAGNSSDMSPE